MCDGLRLRIYLFERKKESDGFNHILVEALDEKAAYEFLWSEKIYGVGVTNFSATCIGQAYERRNIGQDKTEPIVRLAV